MPRPVVVIGHKNPDTDSVCSAVAYAEYKQQVDGIEASAYRSGNINAQTRFVFEHFDREPPPILTDVYPRIRDIMIPRETLFLMQPEDPIARARTVMLENRFTFLPVALPDDTCRGKITALRMAALLDELDLTRFAEPVTLDMESLLDEARGKLVLPPRIPRPTRVTGTLRILSHSGSDPVGKTADDAILVGPASALLPLEPVSAKLAVVVTGKRGERLDAVNRWAKQQSLPVLVASTDMATLCAAIRLSMPLESCLEDAGPTFGPDDLLH